MWYIRKRGVKRKYTLVFVVIVLLICCLPPLIVPIFQLCCGVMMALGYLVGLSYKEVCVIGNVYMQGGLWVLSSLLPLFIAIKALVDRYTISRVITVIVGAIYSVIYTLTFIYFASRYQPPLAEAFDLCVKDLYLVAGRMGTTYEVVNIIFFVAFWGLSIISNYVAYRILKNKYENKTY